MKKVLILCPDPIQAEMAGPAIRSLEIARELSRAFAVTMAFPNDVRLDNVPFSMIHLNRSTILEKAGEFDVVFMPGHMLAVFPFLKKIPGSLILDIYDPILFEELERYSGYNISDQNSICLNWLIRLNREMRAGDHFVCASETQRSLWLGMLMGNRRINPQTFANGKNLRFLIDVVPFGLPADPPVKREKALKGVYPGIGVDDKIVLWGGGIYDWLDPLSAVKAMALVRKERKDIKLMFMGCRHPLADTRTKILSEVMALSDSLKLTGKSVMFYDWVPYSKRADFLLESDIGICLHHESIETDFSYRTRILDCIWAGLPVIATRGGGLSDQVEKRQLGVTVDYNNPEEVADKILKMLGGDLPVEVYKQNMEKHKNDFTWGRSVEPLVKMCQSPVKNIDIDFLESDGPFRIFSYYITRARIMKDASGFYMRVIRFILTKLRLI